MDRMNDPDLARCAHLNMVEAFASLPPHQDRGFVRRRDGVVVAATGSPIALFNAILPVEEGVTEAALMHAVDTVRSAGLASFTQVRDGPDDALLAVIRQLGLVERPDASWPAMVLTDLPSTPVVPEGLEIRHTADGSTFAEHFRASASVAGVEPGLWATWLGPRVLRAYRTRCGRRLADDPAWTMVTGYAGREPVARSMSFLTGDVVGIYNVGTVPAARRRGYGWAVTLAAIMAGVAAGATVATLQSSAMALPMYRAHGFRTLFRYRAFHDRFAPGHAVARGGPPGPGHAHGRG